MARCFLLGAGASYAVGRTYSREIPLDKTFFQLLFQQDPITFYNIQKLLQAQFKEDYELRVLTLEQVEDLVFKTSDIYRKQLESQLKTAIVELLGKNAGTTGPGVLSYLQRGEREPGLPNLQLYHLLLQNTSNQDYFVSLNYDILMDLAILSIGKAITYGNHLQSWPIADPSPIRLYKPHGSLNWIDKTANTNVVYSPQIRIATRLSVLNDELLIGLWTQAVEALRKVDQLVVIGCSLSSQDQHLMQFITTWKSKDNASDTSTKVIHTNELETSHYADVFGGYSGKLSYYHEGFNESSIDFIFQ